MPPIIYILILTWNNLKDTKECLARLAKCNGLPFEILVVDNGSMDGTVEFIRDTYPEIQIIENEKNFGFAKGNNIGINYALEHNADYVIVLNNDVIVDYSFLSEWIAEAERLPDVGILGPIIFFYNSPDKIQSIGGQWELEDEKLGKLIITDILLQKAFAIDYLIGCALLIPRKTLLKLGGFDERFFAYWEDTDLCLRAQEAGLINYCVPSVKVWHKLSGSTDGGSHPVRYYYMARNRLLFVQKHHLLKYRSWIFKWIGADISTFTRTRYWLKLTTILAVLLGNIHAITHRYGEAPKWICVPKDVFIEYRINKCLRNLKHVVCSLASRIL